MERILFLINYAGRFLVLVFTATSVIMIYIFKGFAVVVGASQPCRRRSSGSAGQLISRDESALYLNQKVGLKPLLDDLQGAA